MAEGKALVRLTEEQVLRCMRFADEVTPTNMSAYRGRNQSDPAMVREQVRLGKVAEVAVHTLLTKRGIRATFPDFQIYKGRQKSYAPDIIVEGETPLHVKAMSSNAAKRFGLSWTFQYALGHNGSQDKEIFQAPYTGYVAFCEVTSEPVNQFNVIVHAMPRVSCLHINKLWRDPQLARLKGIKTVIYAEDLFRLDITEQWQFLYDRGESIAA